MEKRWEYEGGGRYIVLTSWFYLNIFRQIDTHRKMLGLHSITIEHVSKEAIPTITRLAIDKIIKKEGISIHTKGDF